MELKKTIWKYTTNNNSMNTPTPIKLKEAQKNREGYISIMVGWDDGYLINFTKVKEL